MSFAYDKTEGFEFNQPYKLRLRPSHTTRGYSSSTLVMVDEKNQGHFVFSIKGLDTVMRGLLEQSIFLKGDYLEGHFVMKKQGQNARWLVAQ